MPDPHAKTDRHVLVGVFAKHWTPGRTKTRLAAKLGDEQAALASRHFLRATLQRIQRVAAARVLAFSPSDKEADFAELAESLDAAWTLMPQPEGSLGDRMKWFFDQCAALGARSAVLLGSDSPDFPIEAVRSAIDWLESPDKDQGVVFGPAEDGGYWLIGARGPTPPVLSDMPWSEANLLARSIERLVSLGWRRGAEYELTTEWCDIDSADDLERLKLRLTKSALDDQTLASLAEELSGLG